MMSTQYSVISCLVVCVSLQVFQVRPNWEAQVPKEKTVKQDRKGSRDLLARRVRSDPRVRVTAVEAVRTFPSNQVSYQERDTGSNDTQPGNIKIYNMLGITVLFSVQYSAHFPLTLFCVCSLFTQKTHITATSLEWILTNQAAAVR